MQGRRTSNPSITRITRQETRPLKMKKKEKVNGWRDARGSMPIQEPHMAAQVSRRDCKKPGKNEPSDFFLSPGAVFWSRISAK